ncbi:Hypothetical predicted protein [Paramuricea clavata]|uniref:Uncharacterized protein n=1 Tax=Paramuricea clavata TaxID=317549 RepID=A0A7D9I7I0_PARCT|nr:Hypothetical predicted protein [Paramuricea clavata]
MSTPITEGPVYLCDRSSQAAFRNFVQTRDGMDESVQGEKYTAGKPSTSFEFLLSHLYFTLQIKKVKFSELSEEIVITELRNLETSKSTGIDMIPARVLKISADIIAPSITWIFSISLRTGIFIDSWKKACVISNL